jgi:hypothetical protein
MTDNSSIGDGRGKVYGATRSRRAARALDFGFGLSARFFNFPLDVRDITDRLRCWTREVEAIRNYWRATPSDVFVLIARGLPEIKSWYPSQGPASRM